jgi:hypothetical protein
VSSFSRRFLPGWLIWPISNMVEMAEGHGVIMNGLWPFWDKRVATKPLKTL